MIKYIKSKNVSLKKLPENFNQIIFYQGRIINSKNEFETDIELIISTLSDVFKFKYKYDFGTNDWNLVSKNTYPYKEIK
ncbi:MAG: hypothetical protein QM564_05645 [Bergeyella sp.]